LWAVGGGGTILHRIATGWDFVPSGTSVNLIAVWGASTSDVWAAGDDGATHWNGSAWTATSVGGGLSVVNSMWGFAANDIWAVGKLPNIASHYNGTAWSPSTIPAPLPELNVVFGAA